MKLDDDQLGYVQCRTKNNIVVGCPGSGKTSALVARLRHLLSTGVLPTSQLVLTFFKTTQVNLHDRLQDVFGQDTSTCVRTLHSVSYAILRGEADLQTLITSTTRHPDGIREFFCGITNVYVDEAQVLTRPMLHFLDSLRAECGWLSIDLFGDPEQNIWTRVPSRGDEYMNRVAGTRYPLRRNYRSSGRIVAFCNDQRPGGLSMLPTRDAGTTEPSLFCASGVEQLRELVRCARTRPPGESFVVLCANRHGSTRLPGHVCCQDVVNHFELCNIRYTACFDENRSRGENVSSAWTPAGTETVVVSTIHGVLGREFDHVHLMAFHFRADKRVPDTEDHYHHQKLYHVAASRARQTLALYCSPTMHAFPLSAPVVRRGWPAKELTMSPEASCKRPGGGVQGPVSWGSLSAHLDEDRLYQVYALFGSMEVVSRGRVFQGPGGELPDYDSLAILYGTFAENVVYASVGDAPQVVAARRFCANVVVVEPGPAAAYLATAAERGVLSTSDVRRLRARWSSRRRQDAKWRVVLSELVRVEEACGRVGRDAQVYVSSESRWLDRDTLAAWVAAVPDPRALWMITLFWYQLENEAAFRMQRSYDEHLLALAPYVREWERYGRTLAGACTQVRCVVTCPDYDEKVLGCADAVHGDTVVELKLVRRGQLSMAHRVQAVGYTQFLQVETPTRLRTRLVNLYTGEQEELHAAFVSTDDLFQALFRPLPPLLPAPRLQIDPSIG